MSTSDPRGRTSIIVVCFEQLAYTQQCLSSIRQRSSEPIELTVVDNGSTDGTGEYVESLRADDPRIRLIRNDSNLGFPTAANQGIQASSGSQVLLLNNDTLVTTGWLGRMLDCVYSDDRVGLVGPCSNFVSGPQQVSIPYKDTDGLESFAAEFARIHDKIWVETTRLVGFCLLIRRKVVEEIGLLDERFGIGNFEDDDYCKRAFEAGWRLLMARGAFVHHFGGRTFLGSGISHGEWMQRNAALFQQKWHTSPTPRTIPRPFRLSLCMIVRDNERTIRAALESIRPWVDEMIVVDTGSKDRTPEICKELGAKVYYFDWCDDFSAARNESIKYAQGEWIFWMDSDDTIDPLNGRKLQELANSAHPPEVFGYLMQVHCPIDTADGAQEVTAVDQVKLFRNIPELRFEGRVHEQILLPIRRAGGSVAWTDIFVVHSGSDQSPEGKKRKRERDLRLLHLEEAERPNHPFTLFNLGMTYADAGHHDRAIDYLRGSIAASKPDESHLRKAYAILVSSLRRAGLEQEAESVCREALGRFPDDTELLFKQALMLHQTGRLSEAAQVYQRILNRTGERHLSSIDSGIRGFRTRQNLAAVLMDLGELRTAEEQWRLVTSEAPDYRPGWRGLAEVLLRQGRPGDVDSMASRLIKDEHSQIRTEAYLMKAAVAQQMGDLNRARDCLERAAAESPQEVGPLDHLCRLLFQHGPLEDTRQVLLRLLELQPDDASAQHNLGMVYYRQEQYEEAIGWFEKSLELRPDHGLTYLHLGYALREAGRAEQAEAAFRQARELAPDDPTIRQAVAKALVQRDGNGRPDP